MSDAPAPGPSPDETETEPATDAAPEVDVPTGEPDADLVAEATGDTAAAAPGRETEPDLPDETEAETEPAPAAAATDAAADADADAEVPTDEANAEPATAGQGLAGEVSQVRAEIGGVQEGVDSMLADLAATAREETLGAGLAAIQKGLDEMVRLARRSDEHVAELHTENQRLRAGELAAATQPMIRDLVRLHDEVAQLASASHPEAQADLELVRSRLLDTLGRWGLTPFSPAAGDRLDATRHHGVGRVASSDGEPGTVATVRRPGFAHDDGRTFRAAEVEVFRAPPPPPTEET